MPFENNENGQENKNDKKVISNNEMNLKNTKENLIENMEVEMLMDEKFQVEGVVWEDLNCNGVRDDGEPLLENILIELYEVKNQFETLVRFTNTDGSGAYLFEDVDVSNYYVRVLVKEGYEFTLGHIGDNSTIDSDVTRRDGVSVVFPISGNNKIEVVDVGMCRLYKIAGKAFYDCNGNGILNDGEPKLECVRVNLREESETGNIIETTLTDKNGYYEFCDVTVGPYFIEAISLPDMDFVTPVPDEYYGSKVDAEGFADATIEVDTENNDNTNASRLDIFIGMRGDMSVTMRRCMDNGNGGNGHNPCCPSYCCNPCGY